MLCSAAASYYIAALALTSCRRYDVGAKEFKPVAAKEVCSSLFQFIPVKFLFSLSPSSLQVGPTTLAVRLLPQVSRCPMIIPVPAFFFEIWHASVYSIAEMSSLANCACFHTFVHFELVVICISNPIAFQYYDKRFRAAALE